MSDSKQAAGSFTIVKLVAVFLQKLKMVSMS